MMKDGLKPQILPDKLLTALSPMTMRLELRRMGVFFKENKIIHAPNRKAEKSIFIQKTKGMLISNKIKQFGHRSVRCDSGDFANLIA